MYLGLLLTSGIVGFAWIVLMMRDINQLEGKSVFAERRATIIFSVGIPAYVLLLASTIVFPASTPGSTSNLTAVLVMAILGLALDLLLLVWLARVSRYVAKSFGYQSPTLCSAATVALFFVGFLSFPILQHQLNALSEKKGRGQHLV